VNALAAALVALAALTLVKATPLIFAALGGVLSERSGVVNIGLEGIMIGGAFTAVCVSGATGSPLLGALGMLVFGLGTVPALVAVGIAGQVAGRRWQRGVAIASPAVMLLNAALLTVLALRGLAIDM